MTVSRSVVPARMSLPATMPQVFSAIMTHPLGTLISITSYESFTSVSYSPEVAVLADRQVSVGV